MKLKRHLLCLMITLSAASSVFSLPNIDTASIPSVVEVQTSTSHVEVQQHATQAVLHWHTFNVGATESVHFQQPANGIILNRVNSANGASEIAGKITATGNVIISNPAGIHFMNSAKVDVAGLIATTANISDKDFFAKNYKFEESNHELGGSISNAGEINAAEHGFVALLGQRVINTGKISAKLGQIAVHSTSKYTLHFSDNELIHFEVHDAVLKKTIKDKNFAVDQAGNVLLTAEAAKDVLDNVIHVPDHYKVNSVREENGKIILSNDYVEVDQAMVDKAIISDYVVVVPSAEISNVPEDNIVLQDGFVYKHAPDEGSLVVSDSDGEVEQFLLTPFNDLLEAMNSSELDSPVIVSADSTPHAVDNLILAEALNTSKMVAPMEPVTSFVKKTETLQPLSNTAIENKQPVATKAHVQPKPKYIFSYHQCQIATGPCDEDKQDTEI